MHATEMLVAIMVPLTLCALVFGIIYLVKKENLAMIEKGMNPKEKMPRPAPYHNLKWGLLLIGAGTGMALAFFISRYVLHTDDPSLWFAFIPIGGGAGLVLSYKIEKKEILDKK